MCCTGKSALMRFDIGALSRLESRNESLLKTRGRLNMSKLPRDYVSGEWVCACMCRLFFTALCWESRVGESHSSPPFVRPLHFCPPFVLLAPFLNAALSSPSWAEQHCCCCSRIIRSACCSKQGNSVCSTGPVWGHNNIIFSLSSDSTAGFHLVHLLWRWLCLVLWIVTVFCVSVPPSFTLRRTNTRMHM